MEDKIIQKTKEYVKKELGEHDGSHDYWHCERVWKLSKKIAEKEGGDKEIIELAALLHDIADWKYNNGDLTAGSKKAKEFLQKNKVSKDKIEKICYIIDNISYKGSGEKDKMHLSEGKIVQDADRLDAIGAIGIGRTFAYSGLKNRPMHHPEIKPMKNQTFEEYKNNKGTTINHFHEKLLLLKDRMNTKTAKKMAEERHKYMEGFLDKFLSEWEGNE